MPTPPNRSSEQPGFTLVELLVVILIIGLLAAIALPSFLNEKGKGQDAKYKSAARSAQTAIETYYTDNGTYATATAAALQTIESTLGASDITLTVPAPTASTYTVKIANPGDANDWFSVARAGTGAVTRACGSSAKACSGGGW